MKTKEKLQLDQAFMQDLDELKHVFQFLPNLK